MKFLLSSIERIPLPILYASFFKTCVCVWERGLGLCNWVVACPDPDDCRVTSAPLIFSSSSFVKVSITEGTPPPFLPYPILPRAFPRCWNPLDGRIAVVGHRWYALLKRMMKLWKRMVQVCARVCVLVLEDTWRDERLKRREVCASGLPRFFPVPCF